jgi:hypothetical protein
MNSWLTLQQAHAATGLRLAPVRAGLPSPWSEFARSCFHVKRTPYSLVDARDADRGLTSIRTLTGRESLPVVFWGVSSSDRQFADGAICPTTDVSSELRCGSSVCFKSGASANY